MDATLNPAFILFAAISPLLIALVKQQGFTGQVNALIALGCYAVVGVLGALTSGLPFTIDSVVPMIIVATLVGSQAYGLVWSKIGTGDGTLPSLDERLTNATSFIGAPADGATTDPAP